MGKLGNAAEVQTGEQGRDMDALSRSWAGEDAVVCLEKVMTEAKWEL